MPHYWRAAIPPIGMPSLVSGVQISARMLLKIPDPVPVVTRWASRGGVPPRPTNRRSPPDIHLSTRQQIPRIWRRPLVGTRFNPPRRSATAAQTQRHNRSFARRPASGRFAASAPARGRNSRNLSRGYGLAMPPCWCSAPGACGTKLTPLRAASRLVVFSASMVCGSGTGRGCCIKCDGVTLWCGTCGAGPLAGFARRVCGIEAKDTMTEYKATIDYAKAQDAGGRPAVVQAAE